MLNLCIIVHFVAISNAKENIEQGKYETSQQIIEFVTGTAAGSIAGSLIDVPEIGISKGMREDLGENSITELTQFLMDLLKAS